MRKENKGFMGRRSKENKLIGYEHGYPNPDIARAFWEKSQKSIGAATICFNNGYYDTSISRSYYAVFQCLITILTANGDYEDGSTTHTQVIGKFNVIYVKKGMFKSTNHSKINAEITSLLNQRMLSDYRLTNKDENEKKRSSEGVLKLSQGLLSLIEKIFSTSSDYGNNFKEVF